MKKATFTLLSLLFLSMTFYGQTNVLSGQNAGISLTPLGINNVILGFNAGTGSTTASNNVFTGFEAGKENGLGRNNVFTGYQAGQSNNDSNNVFIGSASGKLNKRNNNVYTGFQSGLSDLWGNDNVFTGFKSGWKNIDGNFNVFIGSLSGFSLTNGNNNVFIGNSAANNVASATNNTFIGNNAGSRNEVIANNTPINNTYLGANTGVNASGNSCVFIGNGSGTSESQSNRLSIANSSTTTPLIYGKFENNQNGIETNQVGINTKNIPNDFALAVNGNITVGSIASGTATNPLSKKIAAFNSQFIEAGAIDFLDFNTNATSIAFRAKNASNTPQEFMRIVGENGNVGIGTTTPNEKLTVNGKILAEEIEVILDVPADYVFQKYYTGKSALKSDYTMPTLAEVESFTKKNNHLPNVPSAKEIQEKGLQLGEMSNLLLQKIEELTIYVIEQNKKLNEQQKEIDQLKKAVSR